MGIVDELKHAISNSQAQSQKDVAQVAALMEQIKELLKELQVCQNNNNVWIMNTLQTLCDKQGIVLKDPMETNNG